MSEFEQKLEKCVENLKQNYSTVRTGRANPEMLSKVKVESYGTLVPIKQLASINVQDSNVLVVTPFDRSAIADIDRSIKKSDLGFNPVSDGLALRITIPPLTEERRKEYDKIVKKMTEEARIVVRNIRRDMIDKVKKDKDMSQDQLKKTEADIQKTTDKYISILDDLLKHKEKEIMEI